jgi:hypothetical protein
MGIKKAEFNADFNSVEKCKKYKNSCEKDISKEVTEKWRF